MPCMPSALTRVAFDDEIFTTAGSAFSTTGAKLVSIEPGVTTAVEAAATGASAGGCSAKRPEPITVPAAADSKQNAKILVSFQRFSNFIRGWNSCIQIDRRAISKFIPSQFELFCRCEASTE